MQIENEMLIIANILEKENQKRILTICKILFHCSSTAILSLNHIKDFSRNFSYYENIN